MHTANREILARKVVRKFKVLARKLKELRPEILRLWAEFEKLKPGEKIMGCATQKEFCRKRLHRDPRTVRYMLNGGNPSNSRAEIISAQSDTIFEDTWRTVSVLSSEQMLTVMPALAERLRNRGLRNAEEAKTLTAITNAMEDAIARLTTSLAELKPFIAFHKVA